MEERKDNETKVKIAYMLLGEGNCPLNAKPSPFGENIEIKTIDVVSGSTALFECYCHLVNGSTYPNIHFEKYKSARMGITECVATVRYINFNVRECIKNILKPRLVYGGG